MLDIFIFTLLFFSVTLKAGSPGSSGALFLNYSPGSRGSGMADALSSVTDDAYSSYFNPAGLTSVEMLQFGASYNSSIEDIKHQYAVVAYPYKIGQVFSINYSGLSYGDIKGYDAGGFATKNINTGDKAIGFSYARAFTKDEIERAVLSGGATLKYINEKLDSVSANTFALDIGAIYALRPDKYWLKEIPAQEFRFSAVIKNLGPGLKFDKDSASLPTSFTLGASWISHPFGANKLVLSLDNIFPVDDSYKIALGAEYFLFQLLAVRAGYETGKDIGSKLRFGVGFRLSFVDIDYSITPFGDLGNMQKIGILARFGNIKPTQPLKGEVARVKEAKLIAPKEKIKELQMFANDFIKLAEKNIENREYVLALENIRKAFNLDPELKDGKWGKIEERLSRLNDEMKFEKMPEKLSVFQKKDEQAELAWQAVLAYLNGEFKKAYLLAHIAYGTNPKGESAYEELLNAISYIINTPIRRDEILPKTAWITQKLKRAANYFFVRQYDIAARECEEIILIDENNHLAWTRLGSAYFMLGDKEKAKKAYFKALEINPNDTVTLEFLKQQGWK